MTEVQEAFERKPMPGPILLGLIACNIVWAGNAVFSKSLLAQFSPHQTAWLRYASAWVVLVVLGLSTRGVAGTFVRPKELGAADWTRLAIMALGAFCWTPLLQVTGLDRSQAIDNVLIVILEPLISIVLAALLLGERLGSRQFFSIAVGLSGFGLLSGLSLSAAAQGLDPRSLGNALMLLSLLGDSLYTVLGSRLLRRAKPVALFATTLGIGVAVQTMVLATREGLPSLAGLTLSQGLSVVWIGPIGTALSYWFWAWALQSQPVSAMAPTLFIQPVCGAAMALFGLGERLGALQWTGASLMLLSVLEPLIHWRGGKSGVSKKIHFHT